MFDSEGKPEDGVEAESVDDAAASEVEAVEIGAFALVATEYELVEAVDGVVLQRRTENVNVGSLEMEGGLVASSAQKVVLNWQFDTVG